jgi:hypothetical protein
MNHLHSRPLPVRVLALVAACIAVQFCVGGEASPQADGETAADAIAVVNGHPVPRIAFFRSLARTMGRMAIDSFLDRVLVRQAVQDRGIEITDEEVKRRRQIEVRLRMFQLYERARMSAEQFRRAARSYGWEDGRSRQEISRNISDASIRLQLAVEKLLREEISITEKELRAHYNWTRGSRQSGAHIVTHSQTAAQEALEELRSSPDAWQRVMEEYTLDRASVPYSGRMLPVPTSSPVGQALAGLRPGQARVYSDGERWQVLRKIGEIPAETQYDAIRNELRQELLAWRAGEKSGTLLARLRRDATVVTNVAATEHRRRLLGRDIVAYVNGRPVQVSELGTVLLNQFGLRILEPFIERQLIYQQAEEKNVEVSQKAVAIRRRELASEFVERRKGSDTRGQFRRFLDENDMSERRFTDRLATERISAETTRALLLAEKMVAGGVSVSEDELREAYEEYYGEHFKVRRIAANSREEALSLRRRAAAGVSFAVLSQLRADAPLSWARESLVTNITPEHTFFPHLKDLQAGEISPILRNDRGFWLFKVLDHYDGEERPPFESVRKRLRKTMQERKIRRRIQAWLLKLKAESRIEVLHDIES